MFKENVAVGLRVLIAESSRYYGEGDDANPKNVEGVISRVLSGEDGLYIEVKWDNGRRNSYNHRDLDAVMPPKRIRILLSPVALEDGKATTSFCVAEVDDVMNLPAMIESAGFMPSEGAVENAFARKWDSLAKSMRPTEPYSCIYVQQGGALYRLVSKPQIANPVDRIEQLEIGGIYRITKAVRTIFSVGDIVIIKDQEEADYCGDLPYYVNKVNSANNDWVGFGTTFEKI